MRTQVGSPLGLRLLRARATLVNQARPTPAATPVSEPAPSAAVRLAALRSLAGICQKVASLTPNGEIAIPAADTQELVIEVEFSGFRTGRFALGLARGLTRQLGANMEHMVNLDGQPLGAVDAAKELATCVVTELLANLFGAESKFRLLPPQAMPPRPVKGDLALALQCNEGTLAMALAYSQAAFKAGD